MVPSKNSCDKKLLNKGLFKFSFKNKHGDIPRTDIAAGKIPSLYTVVCYDLETTFSANFQLSSASSGRNLYAAGEVAYFF